MNATFQTLNSAHHDDPLQLVFSGECIEGHDPQVVRETVVGALGLDEKRAARLFSGKRVVLKRQVDAAAAHRHIARFAMMGALLRAEPSQALARRPTPALTTRSRARTTRARRWGLLQWVGIGVMGVLFAVVLGLVLGPGMNTVWSDSTPLGAAGSSTAEDPPRPAMTAPAAADVSPATLPSAEVSTQPAAVDERLKGMTAEAMREYRHSYLLAPNHKAFAMSSSGRHAWVAGAPSEDDARARAADSCVKAMSSGDDGCRIVDADGEWMD